MKKTLFIFLLATPLWAEPAPQTPSPHDFIRGLELEGGAFLAGKDKRGAQFVRLQTRYLDPDVNAFVGLVATFSRFNERLRLGEPPELTTSFLISNWGAAFGIIRGRHLFEVDLMGVSLGSRLAFGPAIAGEHGIGKSFKIFHRTAGDFFTGDTIVDSDQGLLWNPWENVGFSVGYRVFASKQMSRNGPRVGLRLRFENPKIPFLFPSLG